MLRCAQVMAFALVLVAGAVVINVLAPPMSAIVAAIAFLFGLMLAPWLLLGEPSVVITPPSPAPIPSTALFDFRALRRSLFGPDPEELRRRARATAALQRTLFAPERGQSRMFRAIGRALFDHEPRHHGQRRSGGWGDRRYPI